MIPTLFGAFGRYGLECKTRKCTVINIVDDFGTPLGMSPKTDLGSHTPLMGGICLIVINGMIYYQLWVKIETDCRYILK